MIEQIYWNSFNCIPQVGPQTFSKLIEGFSDMENAWSASYQDLTIAGILPRIANEIINKRKNIDPETEWKKLEKAEIKMVTIKHKQYPPLLNEITHPPAVIYWKGNWQSLNAITIAIVGTRKPTSYGREVASHIGSYLAQEKICVISGMALGIDGVVHKSALENNGKTIAVLGSGIDILHPRTHEKLASEIIESGGMIVSEFPLTTPPLKYHFPIRNRIISGLSVGTIVIEAGQKSGALITARFALEQNREVFAIPGNIYQNNSIGPNNLIKMGARVITKPEDILETLHLSTNIANKREFSIKADNPEEEKIISIISLEATHIDDIVAQSGLSATVINSTLTLMEMKGKVKNLGGMNYSLAK